MTRHVPLLGSCAVGGMGQAEIDALGLDFHHNWGAGRMNPEAKRIRFTSLHSNGDQTGSGPWIVGNEPNVDAGNGQTDAIPNDPERAGRKAAELVKRLGIQQPIIGNTLETESLSSFAYLTVYLPAFWGAMGGYPAIEDAALGMHWYVRNFPSAPEVLFAALERRHQQFELPVYITEMGIDMPNPPDWSEWSEYIDALLDWSADKPWFKAVCLAQWPTRNHTTTLWKNDWTVWPGRLTPLGMTVRDMWRDARADTTPDPEPEPEGENEWIHMATTTWEHDGWEYETMTRARRW